MKSLLIFISVTIAVLLPYDGAQAGMVKKILQGAGAAAVGGYIGHKGAQKAEPFLEKTVPYVKKAGKKVLKKGINKVFPGLPAMAEGAKKSGYSFDPKEAERMAREASDRMMRWAGSPF